MLARTKLLAVVFAMTALVACALPGGANAAAAKSCVKPGDKVISRTSEAVFVSEKKPRRGWKKGRSVVYACSFTYGKRVRLMEAGLWGETVRAFGIHQSNSRYAAFVPNYYADGSPDLSVDGNVHVVDLRSGKTTTNARSFSDSGGSAGVMVSKLALTERGWIGWISGASDLDLSRGSWPNEVHLRDSNQARVVARSYDIEPSFLRWNLDETHLFWTTSPTSAPAQ